MTEYPKTDKERSEFWGVKIRTLFRWKGDGAPLDNYDEMLSWLSTRKNLPRAVLEKIKLPAQENVLIACQRRSRRGSSSVEAP